MAKWDVYAIATASKFLGTVEAEDTESAKEKARELDTCNMPLCHQCAGEVDLGDIYEIQADESDQ